MKTFLLVLLPVCLLLACSSQKSQKEVGTDANTSADAGQTPSNAVPDAVLDNISKGRIGDSTMFPYVFQGPGRRLIFEAYSMRFTLEHKAPIVPVTNDQVPWVKADAYNVNNGMFITYVRNGIELSLHNPYIQVQYINKSLPSCSSVDSVYTWLDQVFIENSGGESKTGVYTLDTETAAKAICKEYYVPEKLLPGRRQSPKYLAYAYIDYNPEYIIGLGLTTTIPSDFELSLPDFKEIVSSFRLN